MHKTPQPPHLPAPPFARHAGSGKRSAVWGLVVAYVALVLYASLYPFHPWQDKGLPWLAFVTLPIPAPYLPRFDVWINVLGYIPLGFGIALAILRDANARLPRWALPLATLACLLLSFGMEFLQNFLPARVPSNTDWLLNTCGGAIGAALAWLLGKMGALDFWSAFRANWFAPDARHALVLLLLWPVALLYPIPLPWGLGQVQERLEDQLGLWLADTPFANWLPLRDIEFQPLLPWQITLAAALGLCLPCLLAYSIIPAKRKRALAAAALLAQGVAITAFSNALRSGVLLSWQWLWQPVQLGLLIACVALAACLWLPRWLCLWLALAASLVHLHLVNNASVSPYFDWGMNDWLPAQLVRFYGITQWLGWLWPYALLLYLLHQIWRSVWRVRNAPQARPKAPAKKRK
ncbi:MAG: VanZ family protein [Brachymonas sp.]|jgi:VanZ family protein|nr:VanZ family protein [Brachymonas sp.]